MKSAFLKYCKKFGVHPFMVYGMAGILVIVGFLGYAHMRIFALEADVGRLTIELSSTTAMLSKRADGLAFGISSLDEKASGISSTLSAAEQKIEATSNTVSSVQSQVGGVQQAVGTITGTVSTLEKLSKTDPELLQKYSKVFFLNEHYVPERISEIDKQYLYNENDPEVVHASVLPYLQALLTTAKTNNIRLYVRSAYRSFTEQENLKSAYSVTYGAGTANTFSADQGYSEHQLGTAVDFITIGLGGQLDGFETTPAYQWMLQNAHLYGFTLSYPKNNSYYVFEPWHWRYVGVNLATYLHDQNKHFYDLEQRTIDEYLVSLFE
jgi:LAS superfamily LD-carboxypeptidase LdcB